MTVHKSDLKYFLYRMFCGFFIGISIIAPGVSTSVMAVMMGIYRDLINIISNPFKSLKKNFFYLLPMGIGALISIALFVKVLNFLFENYPVQARLLFLGLVFGGLPSMFKEAKQAGFRWRYIIAMLCAFLFAGAVGLWSHLHGGQSVDTSQITLLYLCLAGAVSGIASMIPGMSVSVVLILFGIYNYLLNAASGFTQDILYTTSVILPVALCFLVGMVLFSKLTKYIFKRYNTLALYMIFGFMCGTLIAIFPNTFPRAVWGWLGCAAMLGAGLFISFLFQYLGKKFRIHAPAEDVEKQPVPASEQADGRA